jgi:ribokinase
LLRPGRAPVEVGPPAVEVVDTTGAGDAFAGIFLCLTLAGQAAEGAFRAAVAGASLSATALGAQGRVVTAADLGLADPALAEEA